MSKSDEEDECHWRSTYKWLSNHGTIHNLFDEFDTEPILQPPINSMPRIPPEHLSLLWNLVEKRIQTHPEEAQQEIEYGWLPIHLAFRIPVDFLDVHAPPVSTVRALIDAFPQGLLVHDEMSGNIPLHYVVETGNMELFIEALETNPDTARIVSWEGRLPLHRCATQTPDESLVIMAWKLLTLFPEGSLHADDDGHTPISALQRVATGEGFFGDWQVPFGANDIEEDVLTDPLWAAVLLLRLAQRYGDVPQIPSGEGAIEAFQSHSAIKIIAAQLQEVPVDDGSVLRMAFEHDAPKELCEMLVQVLPNQVSVVDPATGRLLLHVALACAQGKAVRLLLSAQPDTIHAQDPVTGLSPFEVAMNSNLPQHNKVEHIDSIFCLLRADPARLLDHNIQQLTERAVTRYSTMSSDADEDRALAALRQLAFATSDTSQEELRVIVAGDHLSLADTVDAHPNPEQLQQMAAREVSESLVEPLQRFFGTITDNPKRKRGEGDSASHSGDEAAASNDLETQSSNAGSDRHPVEVDYSNSLFSQEDVHALQNESGCSALLCEKALLITFGDQAYARRVLELKLSLLDKAQEEFRRLFSSMRTAATVRAPSSELSSNEVVDLVSEDASCELIPGLKERVSFLQSLSPPQLEEFPYFERFLFHFTQAVKNDTMTSQEIVEAATRAWELAQSIGSDITTAEELEYVHPDAGGTHSLLDLYLILLVVEHEEYTVKLVFNGTLAEEAKSFAKAVDKALECLLSYVHTTHRDLDGSSSDEDFRRVEKLIHVVSDTIGVIDDCVDRRLPTWPKHVLRPSRVDEAKATLKHMQNNHRDVTLAKELATYSFDQRLAIAQTLREAKDKTEKEQGHFKTRHLSSQESSRPTSSVSGC